MKCTACGSAALVEGTVRDGMGELLRFYPSDVPTLKLMFFMGSREVRTYACAHCHNLQLAVDFKESDLERYQQFEGEQPGVLERINSNPKKLED
jgi:hypothetical protein